MYLLISKNMDYITKIYFYFYRCRQIILNFCKNFDNYVQLIKLKHYLSSTKYKTFGIFYKLKYQSIRVVQKIDVMSLWRLNGYSRYRNDTSNTFWFLLYITMIHFLVDQKFLSHLEFAKKWVPLTSQYHGW